MIKGAEEVNKIFASVFPTTKVMEKFLNDSQPGDLLFLHHPIWLISGNQKGKPGKGFVPIPEPTLKQLKQKKLSVYVCHAPLDYNKLWIKGDVKWFMFEWPKRSSKWQGGSPEYDKKTKN